MRGEDEMTDEPAVRLLRPLRQEPEGPARIDVARAMAEGRRRRVLRRWSGSVALIALTSVTAGGGALAVAALRDEKPLPSPVVSVSPSVVAAAPAGPTGCKVARLPTDGVRKALVTAGDRSGRYHVGRLYNTTENTIIWKDGRIQTKVDFPGSDATFYDITTAGIAVGSSYIREDQQQAYVYRAGRMTPLDGEHTAAFAINDAGTVVGSIGEVLHEVPARWDSVTAKVTRLPLPAGITLGRARGIAENGTVVGTVSRDGMEDSGYLWLPDGTGRTMELPTVKGQKADMFWPESITDGWVLGRAVFDAPDGSWRDFAPLRYRISDGAYRELSARVDVTGGQLADNGWVLASQDRPVIVAGSEVVKLPAYKKLRDYWVSSLSANGRVAAGYSTGGDVDEIGTEPILWTCR